MSSALMGTISGSGVANVVASGQFTIPLMKRFGFRSAFAGGVEATSSMGGQIMPPVMGAVAFIMAETLNVPYAARSEEQTSELQSIMRISYAIFFLKKKTTHTTTRSRSNLPNLIISQRKNITTTS